MGGQQEVVHRLRCRKENLPRHRGSDTEKGHQFREVSTTRGGQNHNEPTIPSTTNANQRGGTSGNPQKQVRR